MPAYSIITEQPIDGYDLLGNAEAAAAGNELLDQLAGQVGVRPLMDFFTMEPEEVDALFDLLALDQSGAEREDGTPEPAAGPSDEVPDLDEAPPQIWFEAEEGLTTIRALIAALTNQPGTDSADPADPAPQAILADLRQLETILDHLAAEGIRWHLAVDF